VGVQGPAGMVCATGGSNSSSLSCQGAKGVKVAAAATAVAAAAGGPSCGAARSGGGLLIRRAEPAVTCCWLGCVAAAAAAAAVGAAVGCGRLVPLATCPSGRAVCPNSAAQCHLVGVGCWPHARGGAAGMPSLVADRSWVCGVRAAGVGGGCCCCCPARHLPQVQALAVKEELGQQDSSIFGVHVLVVLQAWGHEGIGEV
jgi:hypothetical protein